MPREEHERSLLGHKNIRHSEWSVKGNVNSQNIQVCPILYVKSDGKSGFDIYFAQFQIFKEKTNIFGETFTSSENNS